MGTILRRMSRMQESTLELSEHLREGRGTVANQVCLEGHLRRVCGMRGPL